MCSRTIQLYNDEPKTDTVGTAASICLNVTLMCSLLIVVAELYTLCAKSITSCWILSHVCIHGNEKVDTEAISVRLRLSKLIPIYDRDWFSVLQQKIMEQWNVKWIEAGRKHFEEALRGSTSRKHFEEALRGSTTRLRPPGDLGLP